MFEKNVFCSLFVQYVYGIFAWLMFGCTGTCGLFAVIMFIGAMWDEWSLLHVLAMLGIAAGFALLSAVFVALHTASGGSFFLKEDKNGTDALEEA